MIDIDTTEVEDHNSKKGKKRSKTLNFLLILSSIYIVMTFSATLQAVNSGPLSNNQIEEDTAEFYALVVELQKNGAGQELTNMVEVMIESSIYQNNEAFYLSNILRLIEFIVGGFGIVFMFQLRKIGFHLYILYSLLPIAIIYITIPQALIINLSIIVLVLIGGFFSLLYGSQLKHMK